MSDELLSRTESRMDASVKDFQTKLGTIRTGRAQPGTVYLFQERDFESAPGVSGHCTGLFEALALGRYLQLAVPDEVVLIDVEAADLTTVGGPVHPAVRAALREVVELVVRLAT